MAVLNRKETMDRYMFRGDTQSSAILLDGAQSPNADYITACVLDEAPEARTHCQNSPILKK